MKVQGKFKMQAHSTNGVVMDIAAFKVSYSTVSDSDATTLQAEKARSASIGAIDNSSRKVQNVSAHSRLRTHKAADSEFSGAMDESSGSSRCKHTEAALLSWMLQPSKFATPLE